VQIVTRLLVSRTILFSIPLPVEAGETEHIFLCVKF
jgi:hypothetical protein